MYKSKYKKASSRITRRSKTKHFLNVFLKLALPVLVIFCAVSILRADFIQLKGVEIIGNKDIKKEEVEKLVLESIAGEYFLVVPKSNMLFFNEDALASKISENFKRAEIVEVSKNITGSIGVNIKERLGSFLWCSQGGECFLMSPEGLIFVRAAPEEIFGKIIFKGGVYGDPIMKNFASSEEMQNYTKVIQVLNDAGFAVAEINLELPDKAVFKTEVGSIFLNPEEDLSLSVQNALLLINEIKSKSSSATFEYIDARFGKKVFYKMLTN